MLCANTRGTCYVHTHEVPPNPLMTAVYTIH